METPSRGRTQTTITSRVSNRFFCLYDLIYFRILLRAHTNNDVIHAVQKHLVRLDAQNFILTSQNLSLAPLFMQQRPIMSHNKLESGIRLQAAFRTIGRWISVWSCSSHPCVLIGQISRTKIPHCLLFRVSSSKKSGNDHEV